MITPEIKSIIEEIGRDLVRRSKEYMDDTVGRNSKAGANTLTGSDVYKSTETSITYSPDPLIEGLYNFYMQYIEEGRPPRHGKQPPAEAIIRWMQKKKIPPRNGNVRQAAYVISRAIWRDGYDGRPIISNLLDWAEREYDSNWSYRLFQSIVSDIEKFFTTA